MKKGLQDQGTKCADLAEKLGSRVLEVAQNSVHTIMQNVQPLIIPMYSLSLALTKVADYSVKKVFAQIKKGAQWIKRRAKSAFRVVNRVVAFCAEATLTFFRHWLYILLMKMLRLLATLWITFVNFLNITFELTKFVGKLISLFLKSYTNIGKYT